MIIIRYLAKEILHTLIAISVILLFIFSCNEFVRYLSYVASGKYAAWVLLQIVLLQMPILLGLLLPLALFLGILLGYGRLCAESEMTALFACGFSDKRLVWITLVFALGILVITGLLSLWVQPIMTFRSREVLAMAKSGSVMQTILPGRFQTASDGKRVYYIEKLSHNRMKMEGIFMAQQMKLPADKTTSATNSNPQHTWEILVADQGRQILEHNTAEQYIIMEKGRLYKGQPGQDDYRIAEFATYGVRTAATPDIGEISNIDTVPTAKLLPLIFTSPKIAAEVQWRVSIPLSVMILAMIALPLSQLKPRQGRFARMLPAVVIYIVYANLIFLAREWISNGELPPWLGMWWIHGLFFFIGLLLMRWQFRWRWSLFSKRIIS
ncbi:MAG: LPS export ABC transporter permease LptF [Gammaproteobacteria bacterium RIFCSPHIGHO2_12_FULL_35_23]|nr:MAG: LPS export ABC transporter permease LptF [Gammaproteobacteria bacterium RIFCSPHIGHO2_12_FULL_35_23]